MLELAAELLPLLRSGVPVAAVSVTRVVHSAPRGVGTTLAVTSEALVIGSISGGCVEQDAVMLGLDALRTGGALTARFGFSGDDALPAGLACGGAIEVIAYPLSPTDAALMTALQGAVSGAAAMVGVISSGPHPGRVIAFEHLPAQAVDRLGSVMLLEAYDGDDVLLLSRRTKPRLIILGAGEHSAALCRVAAASGFSVAVCDAWTLLVTTERFPEADELVVALPHEYLRSLAEPDDRTAICVLAHDERLDVPALRAALEMPVGFVGAMGARATVARRAALLRQAGVSEERLARLHSPLGLDLGGSSPEETAISVVAEIVASRHAASGRPLRVSSGPIHRDSSASCAMTVAEAVIA